MPYSHSGEIGDVWKHLPLCEILRIEHPGEYVETNSAYARYVLPRNELKEYGIFHFWGAANEAEKERYRYLNVIRELDTANTRAYYGSPALAMTVLPKGCGFTFYDLEQPALNSVADFAAEKGLRANTVCADSVGALLRDGRAFSPDTLVFLDPYRPFDRNGSGQDTFDVFEKLCGQNVKAVLWYGYESLRSRKAILERLRGVSRGTENGPVHTFDIWQSVMDDDACAVNPGVPGCGLALCHLSARSVETVREMMKLVEKAYQDVPFDGAMTSVFSEHHLL